MSMPSNRQLQGHNHDTGYTPFIQHNTRICVRAVCIEVGNTLCILCINLAVRGENMTNEPILENVSKNTKNLRGRPRLHSKELLAAINKIHPDCRTERSLRNKIYGVAAWRVIRDAQKTYQNGGVAVERGFKG